MKLTFWWGETINNNDHKEIITKIICVLEVVIKINNILELDMFDGKKQSWVKGLGDV